MVWWVCVKKQYKCDYFTLHYTSEEALVWKENLSEPNYGYYYKSHKSYSWEKQV